MAKAWDIEPSIFAGMIEEDVGLKIRYIAIQILNAIDIAAPVDTGRFRNNNMVSLQHPDFGISDNVDPNGTIAVQRGIGVISKAANYGIIYIQNNLPYAEALWICPYISRHLLSLNPLLARCRRYSRGER